MKEMENDALYKQYEYESEKLEREIWANSHVNRDSSQLPNPQKIMETRALIAEKREELLQKFIHYSNEDIARITDELNIAPSSTDKAALETLFASATGGKKMSFRKVTEDEVRSVMEMLETPQGEEIIKRLENIIPDDVNKSDIFNPAPEQSKNGSQQAPLKEHQIDNFIHYMKKELEKNPQMAELLEKQLQESGSDESFDTILRDFAVSQMNNKD